LGYKAPNGLKKRTFTRFFSIIDHPNIHACIAGTKTDKNSHQQPIEAQKEMKNIRARRRRVELIVFTHAYFSP
jgi:hypothetical protein